MISGKMTEEGNENTNVEQETDQDDLTMFLNTQDDTERDRTIKRLNKENVIKLLEKLRAKYNRDISDSDVIRQDNHDKQAQIVTLQANLTQEVQEHQRTQQEKTAAESRLQDEITRKRNALTELTDTKNLLSKKETVAKELMGRLSVMTPSGSSTQIVTNSSKQILIVVDTVMMSIIEVLGKRDKIQWDKMIIKNGVKGLKSMLSDDESRKDIYKYAKVIILLGMKEILDGEDGFQLAENYRQICPLLRDLECEIDIVELPAAPESKATNVECYNMKIRSLTSDSGISIIETEKLLQKMTFLEMCSTDNQIQPGVFSKVADAIESTSVPTAMNKKPYMPYTQPDAEHDSESSDDEFLFKEEMILDPNYTGLIIGTKGKNIRKLQEDTGSKLHVKENHSTGAKSIIIRANSEAVVQAVKRKVAKQIKSVQGKRPNDDKKQSYKKTKY